MLVPGGHQQELEEYFVLLWDVSVFLGYQGPEIFFRDKDSAVSIILTLLRFSGPALAHLVP